MERAKCQFWLNYPFKRVLPVLCFLTSPLRQCALPSVIYLLHCHTGICRSRPVMLHLVNFKTPLTRFVSPEGAGSCGVGRRDAGWCAGSAA